MHQVFSDTVRQSIFIMDQHFPEGKAFLSENKGGLMGIPIIGPGT